MPKYDYSWVTEAPIRKVKGSAGSLAARLKKNVQEWIKGYTAPVGRVPGVPGEAQIEGTLDMCDYIVSYGSDRDAFVYEICGEPVAILVLGPQSDDSTYISDIVTHPAAEFAGSIVLEFVLTRAARKGRQPVITLWAYDDNAVAAYLGLGFVSVKEPQDMMLDARTSPKWRNVSGTWKYVSSRPMGPKYLQTTAAPLPIPPGLVAQQKKKPLPPIPKGKTT
jgi:hypothetical protein